MAGELDLGALLLLGIAALLLVDVDVLLVLLLLLLGWLWLANAVLLVHAELLVILAVCWDGTREGFDASFVTLRESVGCPLF